MVQSLSPRRARCALLAPCRRLGALAALALSACAGLPGAARLADPQGEITYARHDAAGSPTVVFQSGLGDGMTVWTSVLRRLPADVASFAYDRPGYGGSQARPGGRSPCAIAAELHALLRATGARPPYVLVGHSLGGLYQYAYARLYPQEVAALVLLDPTHPEHWATLQQRAPDTAVVLRGLRAFAFSATEAQEFDAQAECTATLSRAAAPAVTARVLLRTRAAPGESAAFKAISAELAARWAELLPGASLTPVADAGHYLQRDQAARVAGQIVEVVRSAAAPPSAVRP